MSGRAAAHRSLAEVQRGWKQAAARRVDQRRYLAGDAADAVLAGWQRFQQTLGIGVAGGGEEVVRGRAFDLLSGIHDGDPVANLVGRSEIVGGEEDGDPAIGGEAFEKFENLGLGS